MIPRKPGGAKRAALRPAPSVDALRQALESAPLDGCAALLRLYPFDGYPLPGAPGQALHAAVATDPLLQWRVAVALARRGRPHLLAALVTTSPTPSALWDDVRNIIAHPVRMRVGHKPGALAPARVGDLAVQLLNVKSDAEHEQLIKEFAAKHRVHERTVKRALAL